MADASEPQSSDDASWMRRALDLASRGRGRVEPNPMVGCVLVRDGQEISQGWHERFGGAHAEVNALSGLTEEAVRQSDLFVTLEPCAHHGKTPPCAELLARLKPKRVVVAMVDPFPAVSGRGIDRLRSAGIPVQVGVLESEARRVNAPYFKRTFHGLPWVIAKWAMTLDGAIATHDGDSKWITGPAARALAHRLRGRVDAIIVGSETVLRDDPLLTARPPNADDVPRVATRIVIDRRLRIALDSQLVRTADRSPLCLITSRQAVDGDATKATQLRVRGVELLLLPEIEPTAQVEWFLRQLCQRGATNVLVEGGGKLLGAFFDGGWVDQVECFIAPRVLGSEQSLRPIAGRIHRSIDQTQDLEDVTWETCGSDIQVRGYLNRDFFPPRNPR
jgi:diaminohydroxyphosphoribosylaminopyrimidine deaminase/5-amino-6-(5-phosphoribosylamino)uracil reductase